MIRDFVMYGGGKKVKNTLVTGKLSMSIIVLLLGVYILKALVVQLSYNSVAPRLISNWGQDTSNFRQLTFQEALMFTILANFLFN